MIFLLGFNLSIIFFTVETFFLDTSHVQDIGLGKCVFKARENFLTMYTRALDINIITNSNTMNMTYFTKTLYKLLGKDLVSEHLNFKVPKSPEDGTVLTIARWRTSLSATE